MIRKNSDFKFDRFLLTSTEKDNLWCDNRLNNDFGKEIALSPFAEIYGNSNLDYPMYDYNRTGKNGNKRELHVDKASAVAALFILEKQKPYIF